MNPELSVIIMAFNEEEGLPITVAETEEALFGFDYEIVIVDDGSSDRTGLIAGELAAGRERVRVITHPLNSGLGAVYRTGLEQGEGDWITFLPADGELPPANILSFLALREGHDLLLGIVPVRRVSWVALLLSFLEDLLYRTLFGTLPPFQGLFMIRRSVLKTVPLKSKGRGWAVLMELFLRVTRAGHPWCNVETYIRGRLGGHSKVRNVRTIAANLVEVLRLRFLL